MKYINFAGYEYNLFESSLSRVFDYYKGTDFFIVSAFRDKFKYKGEKVVLSPENTVKVNTANSQSLKKDIRNKGLGFLELIGNYTNYSDPESNETVRMFDPEKEGYEEGDDKIAVKLKNLVQFIVDPGNFTSDRSFDAMLKSSKKIVSDYNREDIVFELSYLVPRLKTDMSLEEFIEFADELRVKYGQDSILLYTKDDGKAVLRYSGGIKDYDLGNLHFNNGLTNFSSLSKGSSYLKVSKVMQVSDFEKLVSKQKKEGDKDKRGLFLTSNEYPGIGTRFDKTKDVVTSYNLALKNAKERNHKYVIFFDRFKNSTFKFESFIGTRTPRSGLEGVAMHREGYININRF